MTKGRFDDLIGGLSKVKTSKSSDSEPSKHPDVELSKQPSIETSRDLDSQLPKSKDPDYQRTTVYLPKALHRELRIAAITEGLEMSDVIEDLVKEWLESRKSSDV